MFVRSLRLAGFKSFADSTLLEFEPGVNVIVGPNGSGKSNIADALQWVLGSQAPSSLRGASMEDVIFAGSDGRPRLGLAQVELTLDNSSGLLPLDLAEVTIGRSSDRSGTSEYRINGAPCRLLDVAELLSDTGLGRSLHTLVGQGQLDAVLQARPEDRRAFIEEAAQIGKYRRRKDRTLRKIERVDDNLARLGDVLTEVRRAVRPLKRQASAARAHSELMEEQRGLRQRLAATEVQRLALDAGDLDMSSEQHRAGLLADELAHVEARLGGASEQREATIAAAERDQATLHRTSRVVDRLAGLARLAQERGERIAARLSAETEEGLRERIRLLEAEQERFAKETSELGTVAGEVGRRAESARAIFDERRKALAAAERHLSATRAEETVAAQALVRAEGSHAAGRATIESVEARVKAIQERRGVAEQALSQDAARVAAAQAEATAIAAGLDDATGAAAAAEAKLEEMRERTESVRDKLGTTHAERAAARARVDALEEVASLLADLPHAVARLAPLVDEASEAHALASADENAARRILTQAEAEGESQWQEVGRRDEELRKLDALMAGAAERLAGARRRLEAREIERAALDDEVARAKEAHAGAERAAAEEGAALPARRAAADHAREVREDAERRLRALRTQAEDAQRSLGRIDIERSTAEQRALAAQLRLEEAEAGIADGQGSLEGLADVRESLRHERLRAQRVAEIAAEAARRGTQWAVAAEAAAAGARSGARAADAHLADLRRRERDLERELEAIAGRSNKADVRRAEIRARSDALCERAMEEWGLTPADLLAVDPFAVGDEAPARARIEALERESRRLGPVNPRAAEEYEEAAERERFLVEQTEDLKASRRDLLKIVREVDETILQVFADAYESVAAEFEVVFDRIFPGGSGRLRLSDPGDLLGSGIEIQARPPGKNVRKLSLLSGGERSLVALVFLFSIFRALPSPFYLLDEVEAALDDVNLQRFLALTQELEERAQVMVVTHQKRTMQAADVLYGVTMAKDGVSRVVAQRMDEVSV